MKRLTLGERQYRHRRQWLLWETHNLPLDHSPTNRRVNAMLRRAIRTRYNTPALIHNGRKPRNV